MFKNSQSSRLMRIRWVVIAALVAGAHAVGAQVPDEALVLVPVYTSALPGAYGSTWITHLTVRNDGDEVVPISRIQQGTFPVDGPMLLEPRHDYDISANYAATYGAMIRMPAMQVNQLRFNARVQDLSRQSSSAGVEVPVIRQAALASHIVLLDVPVDPRFRNTLRIYDTAGQITTVRLRIFAMGSDQALVDTATPLVKALVPIEGVNPTQSNINDLEVAFPAIANATTLRVEIDGATATLWAMVSTTNNESQEVTVITPN